MLILRSTASFLKASPGGPQGEDYPSFEPELTDRLCSMLFKPLIDSNCYDSTANRIVHKFCNFCFRSIDIAKPGSNIHDGIVQGSNM